jgi:hypothetical protein
VKNKSMILQLPLVLNKKSKEFLMTASTRSSIHSFVNKKNVENIFGLPDRILGSDNE